MGFSQIRPIPAIFSEKFQISAKKNADPGMIFHIPRYFSDSGDVFFPDFDDFLLRRPTEPTDAHPHPKPTRPIFPVGGSGFLTRHPTPAGRAQNRPGPTRGQPSVQYLIKKIRLLKEKKI